MTEPDDVLSPAAFGRSLHEFLEASMRLAPAQESPLRTMLQEHLGRDDVGDLPTVKRELPEHDLPNLQLALEHLVSDEGWALQPIGLRASGFGQMDLSLTAITDPHAHAELLCRPGPLRHESIELEPGRTIECLIDALLLFRRQGVPLVALVQSGREQFGGSALSLELMAGDDETTRAFLDDVTRLRSELNVYRGRMLAFTRGAHGEGVRVALRELPTVTRDDIVLPAGVLERIERHALAPVAHRERLLAAGRHLKRGVLLHGPPGTGKTTTVCFLAGQLEGHTRILLTGDALDLIEPACRLARELAPAMVVLEDVDLVAMSRMYDGCTPLLFTLLNEMDGLDDELLFVLTTNRIEVLEPALAARPGRVDEAVELPLPDEDALRELIARYSAGMSVDVEAATANVERLAGASPAHVKEWLRKAALLAVADGDGELRVEGRHLTEALDALTISSAEVRDGLLGDGAAPFPFPSGAGESWLQVDG